MKRWVQGTQHKCVFTGIFLPCRRTPHLTLRHLGRSLEFITLSEDSRSLGMLLQWHFCDITLQKSLRREIMKNYLIQALWFNTQLYSNLHSWAEALILRRAETEVCCNLGAAEMPDGSEGKVLAPPTSQLGGLRVIICTSRRSLMLLFGSENGDGDLNLNADIRSASTLVQNCHYIYWQMLMANKNTIWN